MAKQQSGAGNTGDRPDPLDSEHAVPSGDPAEALTGAISSPEALTATVDGPEADDVTGDETVADETVADETDGDVDEFVEELSAKDRNAALAAEVAAAGVALTAALSDGTPRVIRRAERRLDDAKAALYEANIGLADKWAGRFRRDGDLQSAIEYRDAAREGLWEAISTWDPAKGGSLGTWAWPRIKKALFSQVVSNEHAMSTHAFQYRPRVIAAVEQLRTDGVEVTDEAIARLAEVPVSMVARIRQADAAGSALRLDAPAGRDNDGSALADILVIEEPEHIEDLYDLEDLRRLTAGISLVEVWVGLRYHGADGGPPETLAGIGATLGRSREMARKAYNRFQAALQRSAVGTAVVADTVASHEPADTADTVTTVADNQQPLFG
jgi:DNA-directed RNA polymerase specialized sigma subunit